MLKAAAAGRRSSVSAGSALPGVISSGCAPRPIGTWLPELLAFSAPNVAGISGVHTGPGATELTRMPRSSMAWASE